MTNQLNKIWNEVRSLGYGNAGASAAGSRTGVITWILLDVSGSMYGKKLVEAKKAVQAYAQDACPLGELVGLMTFSDVSRIVTTPDNDALVVCERLQGIQAEGGTDLVPALTKAESRGAGAIGVRKIVVVTDGMTVRPDEALAVAERMRRAGWFFVTQGIPTADEAFLEKLRGPQGAGTYTDVDKLVDAMRDAARLLPPARQRKDIV